MEHVQVDSWKETLQQTRVCVTSKHLLSFVTLLCYSTRTTAGTVIESRSVSDHNAVAVDCKEKCLPYTICIRDYPSVPLQLINVTLQWVD